MNRYLKIVLFGFLVWLVPFLVSFAVFPIRASMYPLFESIMSVIIAVSAVTFSYFYLKGIEANFAKEGISIGIIWFIINISVDLIMFMPAGPMHMAFNDYIMGIGLKYLIIPSVAIGLGYMAQNKAK